jgi:2-methylcitrate dehydratase PrpD
MPALTSDIAEFVTSVEPGTVPERCSYGARIGMVDCVGVMIAGAGEPVVRLVAATVAGDKFIDCAKIGLGQQRADAAFRHMNGIEHLASLRDLPLVVRV